MSIHKLKNINVMSKTVNRTWLQCMLKVSLHLTYGKHGSWCQTQWVNLIFFLPESIWLQTPITRLYLHRNSEQTIMTLWCLSTTKRASKILDTSKSLQWKVWKVTSTSNFPQIFTEKNLLATQSDNLGASWPHFFSWKSNSGKPKGCCAFYV